MSLGRTINPLAHGCSSGMPCQLPALRHPRPAADECVSSPGGFRVRLVIPPVRRLHSPRVRVDVAQMTAVPTTKDLASEARAGRFSQARARNLQRHFVRRNWPLLLLLASVILVPSAIAAAFAAGVLRGVLIGASLAATAGILIHFTVLLSGGLSHFERSRA
jgi:hypothetical protein